MWPVSEIAHWAPLVPVAVLMLRRSRDTRFWWIAAAFGVSWIADSIAHWHRPGWLLSATYPVAQYGLLYGVLTSRVRAMALLGATAGIALGGVVAGSWSAPDAVLRLFGSAAVVGMASRRPVLGGVRLALLVYFGLGTLCWVPLAWLQESPGWFLGWWLAYQACRVVGLGLFTVAVARDR